jgi:hypothetical protein
MPVVKMLCKGTLTLGQVKQTLIEKLKLPADSEFVFWDQRQQKVITRHTEQTKCDEIDQSKVWTCVYQVKKSTPDDVLIELNPYQYKRQGRKDVADSVDRAIPRVEAFDPKITIL